MSLPSRILIGMIAGVAAGLLWGPRAALLEPVGTAFLRLITMLVVPLVATFVVGAMVALGEARRLGRLATRTLALFATTTAVALLVGAGLTALASPGAGLPAATRADLLARYGATAQGRGSSPTPGVGQALLSLIPDNPVGAAARGELLPLMLFALLLGVALQQIPRERAAPVLALLAGVQEALLRLIGWVLWIAPLGVLGLTAAIVGRFGPAILTALGAYVATVLAGLLAVLAGLYLPALRLLARRRAGPFLRAIRPAQLIAFGTTSSAATLPVSLRCSEEGLGLPREVSGFVLPLGASLSHDGTALYQAASALFIAQAFGIPLGLPQIATLVLVGTLASFGTAAVPGGGFVNLLILVEGLGLPPEGMGLVLGADRLLDMFRTPLNVTGQLTAATLLTAWEGISPAHGTQGSSHDQHAGGV